MSLDDRTKTAFAFAQESTKQMIGLATGVIALTVTFSKDIAESVPESARACLLISWGAFFASVVCGVWTMLALTGTLEPVRPAPGATQGTASDAAPPETPAPVPSIRGRNVTIPSLLQILTFVGGLLFAVVFAGASL